MDWFERLTGFAESSYGETQARLAVEGRELVSRVTGKRYRIGELELISLRELRDRTARPPESSGRLTVRVVRGNVRKLHQQPEYASALFQVASQFNLLEMVGPDVTPESGVTRYQDDHTQGPACAIAVGAATIYRNYFVPVGDQIGQTDGHQLDGLADVGTALSNVLGMPVNKLWIMRNGYALCTVQGLDAIRRYLAAASEAEVDTLRSLLKIGLHWHVEVTDAPGPARPIVSQAFCSALPVAYSNISSAHWASFARLVLEAAYECTLRAGVVHAARGGSNVVLLTRLGGSAFGNEDEWIDAAMRRALELMRDRNLDVQIVSYGTPSASLVALAKAFA